MQTAAWTTAGPQSGPRASEPLGIEARKPERRRRPSQPASQPARPQPVARSGVALGPLLALHFSRDLGAPRPPLPPPSLPPSRAPSDRARAPGAPAMAALRRLLWPPPRLPPPPPLLSPHPVPGPWGLPAAPPGRPFSCREEEAAWRLRRRRWGELSVAAAAGGGLVGLVCYHLYGDHGADAAAAQGPSSESAAAQPEDPPRGRGLLPIPVAAAKETVGGRSACACACRRRRPQVMPRGSAARCSAPGRPARGRPDRLRDGYAGPGNTRPTRRAGALVCLRICRCAALLRRRLSVLGLPGHPWAGVQKTA